MILWNIAKSTCSNAVRQQETKQRVSQQRVHPGEGRARHEKADNKPHAMEQRSSGMTDKTA